MGDRVNKRQAPEPAQPTGTVDVATDGQRSKTSLDASRGTGWMRRSGPEPGDARSPFFGTMTVYQWVELMAAHEGRHTEQIKEIAAALA